MDSKKWGRYFTTHVLLLKLVISLIANNNTTLEPCCGMGHIVEQIEKIRESIVAIDIIKNEENPHCVTPIKYMNFFDYPIINKFDTIIANPPYVSYRMFDNDITANWKSCLPKINLYMYFIEKCFYHLKQKGELILIIPFDFINNERGCNLRKLLHENGTITNLINLSNKKLFKNCFPDIIVLRYEKDNHSYIMKYSNNIENNNCINIPNYFQNEVISFMDNSKQFIYLKEYFDVRVGIVIGCNEIFKYDSELSVNVIMSDYEKTTITHKYLYVNDLSVNELESKYNEIYQYLLKNKDKLCKRKVRRITEKNWWKWGSTRNLKYMNTNQNYIYVNQRTRSKSPFYIHKSCFFDGTVLALIPKKNIKLHFWCNLLNNNYKLFEQQGLLLCNKYMLSKKKLENFKIPIELINNL